MHVEQRAAFLNAQTACAMIEAMGMQAENVKRLAAEEAPAYGESAFYALIEKYGIDHNSAVVWLQEGR